MKEYLEKKQIKPIRTASYNPKANGVCERANGTLADIIAVMIEYNAD